MKKETAGIRAWALAVMVAVAVWALASPEASEAVADLMGSGPARMGLLWGCGVCVGAGALMFMGPTTALLAYLNASANLARISACVAACYGAFTV